jgi:non-ribosomal peptide synthetase component F
MWWWSRCRLSLFRLTRSLQLQSCQEIFLTYQEVDAFANFLAHTLLSGGLKRGHLVGIYMDKSVEMFISIIGIHKAGAAFVPLDPEYPSERIQTILSLAESKIVLVSQELQGRFDQTVLGCGVESVLVDVRRLSPDRKPDVGHIGRHDISHVLFTSGSTGTPKGS